MDGRNASELFSEKPATLDYGCWLSDADWDAIFHDVVGTSRVGLDVLSGGQGNFVGHDVAHNTY